MNGLPYYKRFPRDIIEGTVKMSFELKGAYGLVLDLVYLHNGNLPDDPRYIAGQLNVSVRKWNSIRNSLVELDKLQITDEFLTNYRAFIELESSSKFQDKQSENRSRPNKIKDLKTPKIDHSRDYTEPDIAISNSKLKKQSVNGAPVAEPVKVGQTVVEIMGVANDPRWMGNYSLASAWIGEGFDPEQDIYPVVTQICSRKREKGEAMPYSLKYFTTAIRTYHQQRMDGTRPIKFSGAKLVTVDHGSQEFDAWIAHFKTEGQKTAFRETQPVLSVPSKLPPQTSEATP